MPTAGLGLGSYLQSGCAAGIPTRPREPELNLSGLNHPSLAGLIPDGAASEVERNIYRCSLTGGEVHFYKTAELLFGST